jgi:hypothetical protein
MDGTVVRKACLVGMSCSKLPLADHSMSMGMGNLQ